MWLNIFLPFLHDHIPLKEGLRHQISYLIKIELGLHDHIPLKEGLRRLGRGNGYELGRGTP